MRYDIAQTIQTYDGKLLPLNQERNEPAMLSDILVQACLAANPQKHATGEAKFKLHKLLTRIHAAEKYVDLSVEEVAELKALVGERYPVAVVGPVFELLEKPVGDIVAA